MSPNVKKNTNIKCNFACFLGCHQIRDSKIGQIRFTVPPPPHPSYRLILSDNLTAQIAAPKMKYLPTP